ncbi:MULTISPECIES: M20/M25/M40 family metallo-hydrolase [Pseudomonas syringae group]|uniref:Glutamate carboxypeptidase n=2 Tax=Pseudomonas syringae group TaxID=136849 RepID=A0A0P9ZK71_PSESI|nr:MULTISPECIES: M20/M25/M40 family metallo-hydrolase [Pseudomonas syringae group]EKN47537.1 glutamate carboxypeptidase [Pseudomonas viridiflava UASWS0038]KPL66521.1 glutamate carboxypeptidase [Pseudomonas viridiflava]KPY50972.1 Glutamate carboxypeptidase [Pseudomonas syringae pv. ribicola]KPZ16307.1 Glutamate carboxypeptidase [Pseudomonas viridiflava]MEE4068974.1 M20/M25/M40 family metallo-hydrolase [Pseudomonas viridiflava]
MQFRRTSVASVIAFSILSASAFAADISSEQLLKKAETEQTAYLETVKQLVDVDTGTGQAPGLKTISALLVERLKALGAEVTTTPATPSAGDNIVGTIKGSGTRSFLLMVHYDTVFGPGTAAKRPFKQDGVRAYGPGVADAKGGVAMILHSLKLLQEEGFKDFGTLTVLFNPDEETGSSGSKKIIAELARQHDYVFSYEPPDKDAVTVATNGINGVILDVKGKSSHAGSAPEAGRNAAIELAHQMLQLKDLGDPAKGTTVNWTLIKGGEKRNIIPSSASAEADMRYSDLSESDRVIADAQRIVQKKLIDGTEVSVRLEKGRPPLAKNPGSEQLAKTAQTLYGKIGRNIEPIAMRFGTDAGYAYVPGSEKPAVLETMGVVGAGLHADDEYIELSSIAPRLYLTVALIKQLSEAKP